MLQISSRLFTNSYSLATCFLCRSFAQNSQVFSFSMIFLFYNLCHKFSDTPCFFCSPIFAFPVIFCLDALCFLFLLHNVLSPFTPIYCLLCNRFRFCHTSFFLLLCSISFNYMSITYSSNYFFFFFSHFSTFFFFLFSFSYFPFYYIHYVQV